MKVRVITDRTNVDDINLWILKGMLVLDYIVNESQLLRELQTKTPLLKATGFLLIYKF